MSERDKHDIEQSIAAFAAFGAGLARMVRAMVDEGMATKDAVVIVSSYARGMAESMHGRRKG